MKLYNATMAPNPRRVRIFLAEKNLQVPMVEVDLAKGEHRTPEFRRMNPMAQVPVLETDDGNYIAESVAICRYFELLHPEPALMGRGPTESALVEMWQRRMELYVWAPIGGVALHKNEFFKNRLKQIPEYGDSQFVVANERLDWMNQELSNRRFVAGDQYTIADITLLVALMFGAARANIAIKPENTHLARWHAEVTSRPSAKA
jgi:glutathione S-transferase